MRNINIDRNEDQWQLASLVIHCTPEHFLTARQSLSQYTGAQLHVDDGHAKMVFTLEANSSRQLAETMDAMRLMTGILSVQMVYHQLDDDSQSTSNSEVPMSTDNNRDSARQQEAI